MILPLIFSHAVTAAVESMFQSCGNPPPPKKWPMAFRVPSNTDWPARSAKFGFQKKKNREASTSTVERVSLSLFSVRTVRMEGVCEKNHNTTQHELKKYLTVNAFVRTAVVDNMSDSVDRIL